MQSMNDLLTNDPDLSVPNPIKLTTPVLINGKLRDELTWDADGLTVDLYGEAVQQAGGRNQGNVIELDYSIHLYMGIAIIIAANPEITFDDLKKQLKGQDVFRVSSLGRFFVTRSATLADESSDEPSDGTPTSSQPPSERSDESPSSSSSSSAEKPPKTSKKTDES